MSGLKIPLTKPFLDKADISSMETAIKKGAIAQGEIATCFETDFAQYLGSVGAVATNSGTSALILALKTVGVKPGDEVILPTYTCIAVLHAVVQTGGTPRLVDNSYDVESMDYNITADKIRDKITDKTVAIIVPHMFGVPAAIDEIIALDIPVIEDITLSLGVSFKGRLVGTWGTLAVCSFHASKMIACGEGGILAASNQEFLYKARHLNGWENEQASLRVKAVDLPEYELRYNFHLSDIASALGISQLRKLLRFSSRRRELAQHYTKELSGLSGLLCPAAKESNIFFRYLVAIERGDPISIIKKFSDFGIEAGRGVYPPLHRFLKEPNDWYPCAERAVNTLISIPLYPALTNNEVDYILDVSKRIFRGLKRI